MENYNVFLFKEHIWELWKIDRPMAKNFRISTKNAKGVINFLELSLKATSFVLLSSCFIKRLINNSLSLALILPIVPPAISVCSK